MDITRKDLESKTIMELRSFARGREISLRRNWKKDEIVQAILRIVRPKRGRKPKPVQRKTAPVNRLKQPSKKITDRTEATQTGSKAAGQGRGLQKVIAHGDAGFDNEVNLMVRDSDTLFAYWRSAGKATPDPQSLVLRIHDVSGSAYGMPGKDVYEIPVRTASGTLYIPLRMPGHQFIGELGYATSAAFLPLASSTMAETPVDRAFALTPRSMTLFRRIYGVPEGAPLLLGDIPVVFSGDG